MDNLDPAPPPSTTRTRALHRIAFVCVALAIGLATPTAARSAAATVNVTEPMHRTVVRDAGISVAYPRSWVPLPFEARSIRAVLRALARRNPDRALRLSREMARLMSDAVRFAVVDVASTHPSSIVVLVVDQPAPQPEDADDIRRGIESRGMTVLGTSTPAVAGLPALRVDIAGEIVGLDGVPVAVRSAQLYLPTAAGTAVVQVTTTDGADGAVLIDAILQRIRPVAGRGIDLVLRDARRARRR